MSKRPTRDTHVVAEPLKADVLESAPLEFDVLEADVPDSAPRPPRHKRRFAWPIALAAVLSLASWTIAQAATLPPLPVDNAAAGTLVADAPQAPIDAVVPTAGPSASASAKPAPFGPQLEVILPPPPPPPASSGKQSGSSGRNKVVTANMNYTDFCKGGATFTATPGSIPGLLTAANAERARIGIAPLSWNDTLAGHAVAWSNQMASDQGSHTEYNVGTQSGRDLMSAESKVKGSAWLTLVFRHSNQGAENIAFAYGGGTNAAGSHKGWMASEGHCKGIMNPGYTQFGAGDSWSLDGAYFSTERFS